MRVFARRIKHPLDVPIESPQHAEEPLSGKDEPPPKPSRLEEARRVIEEYAADLREIIKKLRRRLN
jgi:hypothetical protein